MTVTSRRRNTIKMKQPIDWRRIGPCNQAKSKNITQTIWQKNSHCQVELEIEDPNFGLICNGWLDQGMRRHF